MNDANAMSSSRRMPRIKRFRSLFVSFVPIRTIRAGGFTLVEMLVAVGLFIIVMLVAMGSLIAVVGADRRAQSIEVVVNNLDFALDDMSRTIRTGDNYHCTNGSSAPDASISLPQDCSTTGSSYIAVQALPHGDETTYWFSSTCATAPGSSVNFPGYNSGCIEKQVNIDAWNPLTSPEILMQPTAVKFYAVDTQRPPAEIGEPKAVVVLTAEVPTGVGQATTIHLQTTMTQRFYNSP